MCEDLIFRAVRSHLRICFSQGKERNICIYKMIAAAVGRGAMMQKKQMP